MASSLQVLRGTSVTVTETFQVAGVPADLDSGVPTVAALYPDGTALDPAPVASGTWTGRTTGQYRIVLDAQAEVTVLDPITWVGSIGAKPQTLRSRVEWVGELLFNLAELRAFRVGDSAAFADATAWPDAQLMEARAAVLDELEAILQFSPVPRFVREVHSVGYGGLVILRKLLASRVLSVSVAGVAQSASGYMIDQGNRLLPVSNYTLGSWSASGYGNVVVEYVAGWPRVLGKGGNIAMVMAAMDLDPGISSTASSMTTPDGVSYTFDAAGQVTQAGTVRHTGVPRADAWLNRHAQATAAVA